MVLKSIGAYAVRRSEPDQPLLADSQETLNKVIAIRWIADWVPENAAAGETVRAALLDERWGDAVIGWMRATGEEVDIFPFGLEIHEAKDYDEAEFGPRIQTMPLFRAQ